MSWYALIFGMLLSFKGFAGQSDALAAVKGIEFSYLELYDELEKYQLSFDEVDEFIESRFLRLGLNPYPQESTKQDPAQLSIEILTEGHTIFIEVELVDDAYFLPSKVYTQGTLWKKSELLNAETSPNIKASILLTIGDAVDELLQLYLCTKH